MQARWSGGAPTDAAEPLVAHARATFLDAGSAVSLQENAMNEVEDRVHSPLFPEGSLASSGCWGEESAGAKLKKSTPTDPRARHQRLMAVMAEENRNARNEGRRTYKGQAQMLRRFE